MCCFQKRKVTRFPALIGERSDWFLLSASVEIAERELRLYSVLQRERTSVFARYRSQGEL